MGFYIRRVRWKNKTPNWKVQFVSYKKLDVPKEGLKKPKKEGDILRSKWKTLEAGDNPCGTKNSLSLSD